MSEDLKLARIQQQTQEVADIVKANINLTIDRGDRIDVLMDKSIEMESQANTFAKSSKQLSRKMCLKKYKIAIILLLVLIIILVFIISYIYNVTHNS